MKRYLFVLLLLFIAVSPASAADEQSSNVIGFSKDGRYFAYERYAVADGSGYPYCELVVVDVDKNIFYQAPKHVSIEEMGSSTDEACRQARESLRDGLIDPDIKGTVIRLQSTARKRIATPERRILRISRTSFEYGGRTCTLILRENHQLEKGEDEGSQPLFFSWRLTISCGVGQEQFLQSEAGAKELGGVLSNSITSALIYKDRIAVLLEALTTGFEGADKTPTVVTGLLPPLAAGLKLDMEVLGFSDDDKYFGCWLSGADMRAKQSRAEFHLFSTNNGEEVLKESETGPENGDPKAVLAKLKDRMKGKLAELKLGNDPGEERYKSGTATRTRFKITGSGDHQLRLKTDKTSGGIDEPTELLLLKPDKTEIKLFSASAGSRYSMNTVRLSKSGESLAVILKYSLIEQGIENRAYAVSFAPIRK